ncbi:unnamed protein product [Anisakis simplex]|uniref:PRA1 family protein n=1 Tax=Anisakis simplex TaxID=6269 RepID=A0A0M3JSX8_ANISI|nr:unnamed protein product [Anisakis simplex]
MTSTNQANDASGINSGHWKLFNDLEIPPLRSFSEFIANKARFELPNFRDLPRWNNRLVSNLLYFQTNYMMLMLVLIIAASAFHTSDTIVGVSAIFVLSAAVFFSVSTNPTIEQARREHALATLVAFVLASYYFIYAIRAVIVVLFVLAFPLVIIFVHASLRLRNLKAKINHQVERIRTKKTLMARLLELLAVDLNNF